MLSSKREATKPCPQKGALIFPCINGMVEDYNGARWKCSVCNGTGRVPANQAESEA